MLDDLINIGCAFDWITPALAFVDDWRYGPSADFGASAYSGFDRGDIRRLLNEYGIQVWGLMFNLDGDVIMFSVNVLDAQAAYEALASAGVPLLYAPVGVEI